MHKYQARDQRQQQLGMGNLKSTESYKTGNKNLRRVEERLLRLQLALHNRVRHLTSQARCKRRRQSDYQLIARRDIWMIPL